MKKTLLALSLFASTVFAEPVVGVGEYNYGPNTSETLACTIAEEKAKEAAILKKVGEIVEIIEYQTCDGPLCDQRRDFVNNITGLIKSIISTEIETIKREGMTSCIVTITAEVEPMENDIAFNIYGDSLFKANQEINFTGVSSHTGKVYVFSQDGDLYKRIYETQIEHPGYEFKIPDDGTRMIAKLPADRIVSNERLLFLFLGVDISVKEVYNHGELSKFLESVPVLKRRVIYQLAQIVR